MSTSQISRSERIGALLLVLMMALPIAFLTTPPMVDILGHMGRFTLQTGLDQQPFLQSFYSFEWQIIGNLGADLIVQLLHPILGVVGATKLTVLLVPLIATTAIVALSCQIHGRITPFAVLSLALVFCLPFTWGFLNFSLAMSLALLAFVLWLRLGRGWPRILAFLPISVVVWLCHTFGLAFLGILCTAEALARRWPSRRSVFDVLFGTARDCAPLLAPLIPMVLWRSSASGSGIDGWFDFQQKAGWLISIVRLDGEWTDKASASVLLAVIAICSLSRRIKVAPSMAVAAIIALIAFLVLPRQIFGSVFADMRLAPYVVMIALLAFQDAKLTNRAHTVLMVAALTFLGFRLALTTHVYQERERQLEAHLAALTVIPEQARVATLVQIPCQSEWALPWFSHIGSVAITRKHVFANDQWANSSMNPLKVHFPAAGAFATDDRQLFFPEHCGMQPTLAQSLSRLPTNAFTHVWIIGPFKQSTADNDGLRLRWRDGNSSVFTVNQPLKIDAAHISKLSKLRP